MQRPPGGNIPNMVGNPFNPMAGGMMPGMPPNINMPMIGSGIPMAHHNMPPNMNQGMPPKPMPGPSVPNMMGAPSGQLGLKERIASLLRDRERMMTMPENSAKRIISDCLKGIAE